MNSDNSFAFFSPKQIKAENPKNIHIVAGSYDPQNKVFVHRRTCCCGKCSLIPNASYNLVAAENTEEATRMKARAIAMGYEDRGETVCGQCVATLYSDDI